jgi:hypothetical protein
MIKENKVRCLKCNDVIESKSSYDRVTCSCGAVSVDGGKLYLKRTGKKEDYEELSVRE